MSKTKGNLFLKKCFKEVEVFNKLVKIDSIKTHWIKPYGLFKKDLNLNFKKVI